MSGTIFENIKGQQPIRTYEESLSYMISKRNQQLLKQASIFNVDKNNLDASDIGLNKLEKQLEEIENNLGEFFESCSLLEDTIELRLNISSLSHSITGSRNKIFLLRTNLENEKSLSKIKELKTENKNLKTEIIGITTLIFTAFTLIQLNFQAFSGSNSYDIYNRILLITGINISLFFPIYIIFTFIKHLINDYENIKFDKILKAKFILCISALILIAGITSTQIKSVEPLKINLDAFKNVKLKLLFWDSIKIPE